LPLPALFPHSFWTSFAVSSASRAHFGPFSRLRVAYLFSHLVEAILTKFKSKRR